MSLLFIELKQGKDSVIVNASNIVAIYPNKKRGSILVIDMLDDPIDVDDSPEKIIRALTALDLVRRPANVGE